MEHSPNDTSSQYDAVATELKARPQWVLYRLETPPGKDKPTKVPYSVQGGKALTTDALTWGSFEAVKAMTGYDGIGFVFSSGDPYTGIDFDDCLTPDGNLKPWAVPYIEALVGKAYLERSQSGTGLHVIIRGKAHLWHGKHKLSETEAIEVYSTERFFVMTGDTYGPTVARIAEAQAELNTLCQACKPKEQRTGREAGEQWSTGLNDEEALDVVTKRYGRKFTQPYYLGDLSQYDNDHSSGDMALVGMLAYGCGPNPEQIDQLFRGSKLYRDKWDKATAGSTYGANTITKVLKTREPDAYYGASKGKHQPIRLLSVEDVIDRPAPETVIDGLIDVATVNTLIGPSSTYKSFTVLDMALSVALGIPWQGHQTKQGAVLSIVAEGAGGIGNRYRAWAQHHQREIRGAPLHIIERPISFYDPTMVDQLKAILAEQGREYMLIIVDTLSRNSVGADENSNSEMVQVINNLQELASATGAAVLIVHHVAKGTGTMRGASAVLNSVDASFKAERDESGHVQITTDKQKDHDDSGVITLERKLITLPDGQTSLILERVADHLFEPPQQRGPRGPQTPKPYAQALSVLRLLCQQSPEGVTRQQWLAAAETGYGAKRGTFDHHRADLIADKLIEHDKAQGLYRPLVSKLEGMLS